MTACDDPEFHYELGANIFIAGVEALAARARNVRPNASETDSE
jgi:hypothetical protein